MRLPISRQLQKKMVRRGFTLSLAESCTGGLLASRITSVSGASQFFKGAIVTYIGEAKVKILKVKKKDVETEAAVNTSVARQMALRAQEIFKTDFALSTTGIAGPLGGSQKTPVGTVFFGFATPRGCTVQKKIFKGSRIQIQKQATEFAIKKLLHYV